MRFDAKAARQSSVDRRLDQGPEVRPHMLIFLARMLATKSEHASRLMLLQ